MIGVRSALAVCLVIAVVGATLGFAALVHSLRDDAEARGRLVETLLSVNTLDEPVPFPVHDFYLIRGRDGVARALYVYPPGYYGHTRGCRVVWAGADTVEGPAGREGPGLFVDPCGGSRFTPEGRRVSGPADRGLDWFITSVSIDGIVVDTRALYCGETSELTGTPSSSPVATPTGESQECGRVSQDTPE